VTREECFPSLRERVCIFAVATSRVASEAEKDCYEITTLGGLQEATSEQGPTVEERCVVNRIERGHCGKGKLKNSQTWQRRRPSRPSLDSDTEHSTSDGGADSHRMLGSDELLRVNPRLVFLMSQPIHFPFSVPSRATAGCRDSAQSSREPSGLRNVGKVWWLDVSLGRQRHRRIRVGGDVDSVAALQLVLGYPEAIKQDGKAMAAFSQRIQCAANLGSEVKKLDL